MSLKDTVDKMNKLFGKAETQVSQRYKCLQLAKADGEDFKEYASRVNLQCELFKMTDLKIDQFKCLIFVLGLKSSKDTDIRVRLLKILDEFSETTNLDKLVDETQRIMDLKSDNIMIEHQPKSICFANKKENNNNSHKLPKTPCWLCGDLHFVKFCPYVKHKCTKCQQIGHKDNYCSSSKPIKTKSTQNYYKDKFQRKSKFRTNAAFTTMKLQFKELRWPENSKNIHSSIVPYFNRKESLSTTDGCVMFNNRIVIPDPYRQKILRQLHRGHISAERCKSIARSYVYWPCIDKQIEDFIKKCQNCQQAAKNPVKTDLCSWPITTRPLERLHIDYAGPLKNKYYLVSIDPFSKYPAIYETPTITSFATIKIMNDYCAQFGNPEQIVSDNGTQFSSEQFQNWCKERAIEHTRTVRFHPSSNGQAERFVDTLKRALKKAEGEDTPTTSLQTFLEVYRSTPNPNSPNGKSPAESFIGRKMRTVFDIIKKPKVTNRETNQKMEKQYNTKHGTRKRTYLHGDQVYALNFKGNKQHWVPGEFIEKIGNVVYNTLIYVANRKILVRSDTDQLRLRYTESDNSSEKSNLPLEILLEEFKITPPLQEETFATPTASPCPTLMRITSRRKPVEPFSRSPQ
ncbi:uncharacterized protein K02A2.6-like [Lucilia sericata]|uniref:uncharacterized protein K02A2.6-like n=1 Tax=Lucilia sericata TaxID=13632 RepID=UPI0018A7FC76|nr:uncharacterized protein K02A2.6-like [Lucilia sericata]